MQAKKHLFLLFINLLFMLGSQAQTITGVVVDAHSGDSIPFATIAYAGTHVGVTTDNDGMFSIVRKEGKTISVSYLGYIKRDIPIDANTPGHLHIELTEDSHMLSEVVVRSKGVKYSRKNNPAVELMRRVIAAKQTTRLENNDYYQYTKYQKLTMSVNDYSRSDSDSINRKLARWAEFAEESPYNHKMVLPLTVNETVTQHVYRKSPRNEKDIVLGKKNRGINEILFSGEMINTVLAEVFQDVDISEDYVRLLQYPFVSPIGREAISFYHFYISDTVSVDKDECYHLKFYPANKQDMGFKGDLYVLADSTLHVKRCEMELPQQADVNFVTTMHLSQQYRQLEDGQWVLSEDEMWAEMKFLKLDLLVVRSTLLNDHSFDELPKNLFRGKAAVRTVADAYSKDDDFWASHRHSMISEKENAVSGFMDKLRHSKSMRIPFFMIKLFAENYIETGSKGKAGKFDFGPMMSAFSYNEIDGFRTRLGGRTMAALNPHWFWDGYIAQTYGSGKTYYGSNITYSLNKKQNSPFEFPRRTVSFESTYDIMSMADKYLTNSSDNLLVSLKTERITEMYRFSRQKLGFIYETDYGLNLNTSLKIEKETPVASPKGSGRWGGWTKPLHMTEWQVGMNYCPGQSYINTKQNRLPINFDNPEIRINHTMGLKNFLGGDYKSNVTELKLYRRQWLGSFGYIDLHLEGAAQWNKVPFPLLMTPPIDLSYIEQEGTMNMLHNMEFFMDRKFTWMLSWDMNGKIFHRIPLLKKLKIREYFAFKGVLGKLTDKNNPFLAQNAGDPLLFQFPEGSGMLSPHRPYMEFVVGIRNILKFFSVEWVRRLNYNDKPDTAKNGVRFGFWMSF